jgi:hypothetical protein
MTVLRLFESIKLRPEFDPNPITKPYSGKPLIGIAKDFESFSNLWFKRFGKQIKDIMVLPKLVPHDLSFRFKSGPMGPSILTAHLDAHVIKNNEWIFKIFAGYCTYVQSWQVFRIFQHSCDMVQDDYQSNISMIMGKISLASEAAGKTRLFAICNF